MLDLKIRVTETEPAQQQVIGAVEFLKTAVAFDHLPRGNGEIAGVRKDLYVAQKIVKRPEAARKGAFSPRVLPVVAQRVDDVVALQGLAVKVGDLVGAVLQVAVHHHHPIAGAVMDAGGNRIMLAEIAGEVDGFDPAIERGHSADRLPGIVRTPVVDQNDLEGGHQGFQRGYQLAVEFGNAIATLIHGSDHRDLHPRPSPCAGR